jgi:aryl-alcohol dehydrogenase-like predicted oxidoreductase
MKQKTIGNTNIKVSQIGLGWVGLSVALTIFDAAEA